MKVVRLVGIIGSLSFLVLAVLVAGLLVDDVNPLVIVGAIVPAAAAYLFFVACLEWDGRRQHITRIIGWLGMLPSAYGLVSFSFIVWPLLLLMLPAALMGSGGRPSTDPSVSNA